MKLWGFAAGMAAGMAAAAFALTAMYPGVGRKMKRDGKRLWQNVSGMF